jgi:hypothetical protein
LTAFNWERLVWSIVRNCVDLYYDEKMEVQAGYRQKNEKPNRIR